MKNNLYKIHFINILLKIKVCLSCFQCVESDHLMVALYIELISFHLSLSLYAI